MIFNLLTNYISYEELGAIIEPILALPPSEFTPMLMQLSREELVARFAQ